MGEEFGDWPTDELDDFIADYDRSNRVDLTPIWLRGGYDPLPSQQIFHDLKTKYKGFSGPIGSGKSSGFARECIRLAFANPGCWGIVASPTYPMLRDSTLRELLYQLTQAGIAYRENKSQKHIDIPACGCRILYRSLDNPNSIRGPNIAWFGVDELTYASLAGWEILEGRLRDNKAAELCGMGAWTAKGFDFVWEKFIDAPSEDYSAVLAKPFENKYLAPSFYESLKSSYSPEFYDQEVLGKYLNCFSGQVYKAFDRASDIKPTSYDWRNPISLCVDFNVDPMAWLITQIDEKRRKVTVLDEIFLRNSDTDKACKEFDIRMQPYLAERSRNCSYPLEVTVFGDASGGSLKTSGASRSDYGIMGEFFAAKKHNYSYTKSVPAANGPVKDRVIAVNSLICNANGDRGLTIDPVCRELIKDLEQVAFERGSSAIEQKPGTLRTHISDALGYAVVRVFPKVSSSRMVLAA